MGDVMAMPETIERFLEMYSFEDGEWHYTNGDELIQVDLVKRAIDYYFGEEPNKPLSKSELLEMKDIPVWDDKYKQWTLICDVIEHYGLRLVYSNEATINIYFNFDSCENRFYKKEVKE
jgi:hypothetical protein